MLKLGSNQDVLPKVKGQMNCGPSRQRSYYSTTGEGKKLSGHKRDFPGSPVVKSPPSNAGARARSLVGGLRSCMMWGASRKKKLDHKRHGTTLEENS